MRKAVEEIEKDGKGIKALERVFGKLQIQWGEFTNTGIRHGVKAEASSWTSTNTSRR